MRLSHFKYQLINNWFLGTRAEKTNQIIMFKPNYDNVGTKRYTIVILNRLIFDVFIYNGLYIYRNRRHNYIIFI
jgi:hypothetical protein